MARRIKPQPASQQSLDALAARMESGFSELKTTLVRFAADVDRRFAKTATLDMLSDVKTTVDRHTAVLDHIVGEIRGLQESRVLLNAMYGDHGRRLTVLETRQLPPTP
jgi:hypothetical protein